MKKQRSIPCGWSERQISEIFNTTSGGTPLSTEKSYYEHGTIPWINSGELNDPYIRETKSFITETGMYNSSAKMIPENSVLVAMYGATAGKASLLKISATTNQAICAILPQKGYSSLFLKYSIDNLYSYLVSLSSGSARSNLSQEGIGRLKIVFPPYEQQLRIADIIHDLNLSFLSWSLICLSSSLPFLESS